MTTRLTGYLGNAIQADDTYILAMIDPQMKWSQANIALTRNAAYDGTITVKSRPIGSSAAFLACSYVTKAGVVATATFGAASDEFSIDTTGREIALVSIGRTVGSMSVDVAVQNEA